MKITKNKKGVINMFCEKCGAQIDGQAYCPQCGTPTNQTTVKQPIQYQTYPAQPNQPVQTQVSPTSVLIWCIVGAALSWTGIVGLIFSIIGLRKANAYINTYGPISTQAKIGKILSIIGIVCSAIMTFFWIIWTIVMIIGISVATSQPIQIDRSYIY